MSDVPESAIRVKCYDHSSFSRASVEQFQASRWIMSSNRTSVLKVMTIRISQELPLFNFEHLDILFPRIGHPCENLWPFEFVECFRCSISCVSIYHFHVSDLWVKCYVHTNSRELPLFNFERLDILCPRIGHPCENLWPFEFLESFRYSITSVLIYYVPKSDIRVKTYDHSNFSRASVVQFRVSRWVMSPNWTFVWKVMTIQICRELPLNSFEGLDILYPRIEHPSQMLWPFEFLESFRC